MDRNLKIGIIGLGLIGGSIFKALCKLNCNVFATSKSASTIKKAKTYSKNVSKSIENLKNCDIIFVCTPMNKTLLILDKLNSLLTKKTIVLDACSLKKFVSEKDYNFKFIPSHPMAGTEFSGFDNSFETLFQGAKWVITPNKKIKKTDIDKVKEVIEILGAKVIKSSPEDHDEAVALISHMPMLISQALFKTAKENKLAMKLASSGFRDMTRLAMSNTEMASDMIDMNDKNIQAAILNLYSSIGDLLNNDYEKQIKKIKNDREQMYVNGKNLY